MKYMMDKGYIFITLSRGDPIIESLQSVASKENLISGWINGIGAIDYCKLGFYNFENQTYVKKEFSEELELTGLTGNIAIKEGSPFIHAHVTVSDRQFAVKGGHLFEGKISAAGEFIISPGARQISREMNPDIGLALWSFGGNHAKSD